MVNKLKKNSTDKKENDKSIFYDYYNEKPFEDRFEKDSKDAVDVIIPIIHTNELWKNNLISMYREIPINRLLIGDGGCIDNSIDIVKQFPRVKIFNHKKYKSLGYSIRKLIEEVETKWFVYPHSDVYLPEGWFENMKEGQKKYDWFGCPPMNTILFQYLTTDETRPFAGSQMGKKSTFMKKLNEIDDDYVYRQEDFVFENIIKKAGGKNGRIYDTFHYHQTMNKKSAWKRDITKISIELDISPEERVRSAMTQTKGIIKYLDPNPHLVMWVSTHIAELMTLKKITWKELNEFIDENNPLWKNKIKRYKISLAKLYINLYKDGKTIDKLKKLIFKGK